MQDWRLFYFIYLFFASRCWRKRPIQKQTLQSRRWLNPKGWKVCFLQTSSDAFLKIFFLLLLFVYVGFYALRCLGWFSFCLGELALRVADKGFRLCLQGVAGEGLILLVGSGFQVALLPGSFVGQWLSVIWKGSIQRCCVCSTHFYKPKKPSLMTLHLQSLLHDR